MAIHCYQEAVAHVGHEIECVTTPSAQTSPSSASTATSCSSTSTGRRRRLPPISHDGVEPLPRGGLRRTSTASCAT